MKKLRSRDYKKIARQRLLGKYGTVIGASFISGLSVAACLIIAFMSFYGAVLSENRPGIYGNSAAATAGAAIITALFLIGAVVLLILFMAGEYKLALNIGRNRQCSVKDIFFAFERGSRPFRFMISYIMISAAGFVLLEGINTALDLGVDRGLHPAVLIPIAVLCYVLYYYIFWGFSFNLYIRTDRPDSGIFEALGESFRLMRKRRIRLFLISLSFLPWIFIVYITFGIAILWLAPYMQLVSVLFYLDAKGELIKEETVDEVPVL